jgi:hypothetical protein
MSTLHKVTCTFMITKYSKGVPPQAEEAQGVPGRLRRRMISMLCTIRVVGRQPYAPAAFTPGEIPGTHFQKTSRPQAHGFVGRNHVKQSPITMNRSRDRPTSSAVP